MNLKKCHIFGQKQKITKFDIFEIIRAQTFKKTLKNRLILTVKNLKKLIFSVFIGVELQKTTIDMVSNLLFFLFGLNFNRNLFEKLNQTFIFKFSRSQKSYFSAFNHFIHKSYKTGIFETLKI